MIGVIMKMKMVMMKEMEMKREKESGKMENMLEMKEKNEEIMMGKILKYIEVGGVKMVVVMVEEKIILGVNFVG